MVNVIQKKIIETVDEEDFTKWENWKWHLRNRVTRPEKFEELMGIEFPEEVKENLKKTIGKFPMSVTPYYLSLIDPDDYLNDPVFKQCFPSVKELCVGENEMSDPLHEDEDSPVEGITHRYPDRVLFLVSNMCSMYCRHCTRKRKVGDVDFIPDRKTLEKGLDYIRNTPQVRDVLLSGGDPLMLDDDDLEWILSELYKIEHVEIVRIGSRMPVVLPQRITDSLLNVLKKYHKVWINTHFNHPQEITRASKKAINKIADAGIPVGNQSVLLAGVNDCPVIMKRLMHLLVKNRVRPYYLYQCDMSEGLEHFRTPVGKGIQIMESLIGHTTGFCVPTYVIDAPGGGGKIPVMPNYLISWSSNRVVLRNYEGVITCYKEPDSYQYQSCDKNCSDCDLQLKLDEGVEHASGIEMLLADYDDTVSLIPQDNDRINRRLGDE